MRAIIKSLRARGESNENKIRRAMCANQTGRQVDPSAISRRVDARIKIAT